MLSWIILYALLAAVLFIFTTWMVTKSEGIESKVFRITVILTGILFLGVMVLVIPFIPQARLENFYLQYLIGIPLAIIGIALRVYPMLYFKRKGTRSDLVTPSKLVTTGPYGLVRHPQYAGGMIFIIGWFLIWGGIYSFYVLPLVLIAIFFQALIEEKYILEKEFGAEYLEYKKKVGMFFPKIIRK